jgi:hypothetical protein
MTHRIAFRLSTAAAVLAFANACGGGGGTEPATPVPTAIIITTSPSASSVVGSSAGIFAVEVEDATGAIFPGAAVTFSATGGATTSPTTAVTNANGIAQTSVTLGAVAGAVTVSATVTGTTLRTDAAILAIAASTGPVTCVTPAIGEIVTYSGVSGGCVTAAGTGGEYAIVAYNSTADGSVALTATLTGTGLAAAPTTARIPSSLTASRGLLPVGADAALVPDEMFHIRQRERAQAQLQSRMNGARSWYRARTAPGGARRSAIPATPTVGQIITLNVNGDLACTSPTYHGVRIEAIGTKSIVMSDTLNPSGGFTTADYQRFAARFDTLVYPLDVNNFGAPSDIDKNGKIAIIFTRSVNEETPANSPSFVGGFFFSRDLFPVATTADFGPGCAGSNEGEMFYMLAPDPNGVVNHNVRRTGFVDTLTTGVLAHEFQHLINASRRLYVNTSAAEFEVTWLDEGLAHVAEELLYYRESGKQPRQNLSGDDVYTNSRATYPFFKADAASNFARFSSYLSSPDDNSPIADNDDLATRGATWSFLRYAADQVGGSEAAVWTRFGNSTTSGLPSVQFALGQDPVPMLRSWALANYLDDLGITTDPHFQHLSWNYRSVYNTVFGTYDATGTIFTPSGYPLQLTKLANNTGTLVSVLGASASYYRFAVAAGQSATLTFANGAAAPSAALQFNVIRTK